MGKREVKALEGLLYGEGLKSTTRKEKAKQIVQRLQEPVITVQQIADVAARKNTSLRDTQEQKDAYNILQRALDTAGVSVPEQKKLLEQQLDPDGKPVPYDGINDQDLAALQAALAPAAPQTPAQSAAASTAATPQLDRDKLRMQFMDAYETALNVLGKYDDVVTDELATSIHGELQTYLTGLQANTLSSTELQDAIAQAKTIAQELEHTYGGTISAKQIATRFVELLVHFNIPLDNIETALEVAQQEDVTVDRFVGILTRSLDPSNDTAFHAIELFLKTNYNDGQDIVDSVATALAVHEAVEAEEQRQRDVLRANAPGAADSSMLQQTHSNGSVISGSTQMSTTSALPIDPALRLSIDRLTRATQDSQSLRRLTKTGTRDIPGYAGMNDKERKEAKRKKEAELQADPLVQRMLSAGVITLKDIVKGDTIPLLESDATRKVVQGRLDQLEQEAQEKLKPMVAERAERQTKAFQRTIPNTNFKMYVPPRYAPAGTPGAKRQRPETAGAMIGFPTGAYYT